MSTTSLHDTQNMESSLYYTLTHMFVTMVCIQIAHMRTSLFITLIKLNFDAFLVLRAKWSGMFVTSMIYQVKYIH